MRNVHDGVGGGEVEAISRRPSGVEHSDGRQTEGAENLGGEFGRKGTLIGIKGVEGRLNGGGFVVKPVLSGGFEPRRERQGHRENDCCHRDNQHSARKPAAGTCGAYAFRGEIGECRFPVPPSGSVRSADAASGSLLSARITGKIGLTYIGKPAFKQNARAFDGSADDSLVERSRKRDASLTDRSDVSVIK